MQAIQHLQLSLTRQPDGPTAQIVKSALAFCELEMKEVNDWMETLARLVDDRQGDGAQGNDREDISVPLSAPLVTLIARRLFTQVKDAVRTLLRSFNACSDESLLRYLPVISPLCSALGLISAERKNHTEVAESVYSARHELLRRKERMLHKWQEREVMLPTIDRVAVSSAEELMRYIKGNKPVVITNFQDSWSRSEEFSNAALKEKFGDDFVRVSVSESGRFDGPEPGELWGLRKDIDGEILRSILFNVQFYLTVFELLTFPLLCSSCSAADHIYDFCDLSRIDSRPGSRWSRERNILSRISLITAVCRRGILKDGSCA